MKKNSRQFLMDYTEQHFKLATHKFKKVTDGILQIERFYALVVSLENIPDIDTEPETYLEHWNVFKNIT